jgi:RNA recognition motif-containing protein
MVKRTDKESNPKKKRKVSEDKDIIIPFTQTIDIIVSGLPDTIESTKLQKLFKKCGEFDIALPKEPKGVTVLKFASQKNADKALELNGGIYKGKTLLINTLDSLPAVKKDKPVPTTVFVGNLASNTTEDQLKSYFSGVGTLKSIRLNAEKGFAHIVFTNRYSAELSEKLLGGKLNGKRPKIEIADKKQSN